MTNTQKPLWKELNEQRTQGELVIKHRVMLMTKDKYARRICGFYNKDGDKLDADIAYTALAVNNFANVVEALERCKEWFYLNAKDLNIPLDGSPGTPGCWDDINKALNPIS